jgi:hypothetical protein
MQPLRRLTAIVLNVLLIQVNLARDGAACAQRGDAMGAATIAAMAMTHGADVSRVGERLCAESATDTGCSHPGATEECATMTPCAAPALPARNAAPGALGSPSDRAWGDPGITRQGPRPAPDLPPPRA